MFWLIAKNKNNNNNHDKLAYLITVNMKRVLWINSECMPFYILLIIITLIA